MLEGNSGTTVFHFTVNHFQSRRANGVTFDINTQDNAATTADNDYVQKSFTSQSILQAALPIPLMLLLTAISITAG